MRYAHITFASEEKVYQTLCEHCEHTAEYARDTMADIGFGELAYVAGLLHDMGKGTVAFNKYLEDASNNIEVIRGSVNHTFAGVIYILEKYHGKKDRNQMLASEIIAYAIGAHHGLFDCVSLDGFNGFEHRLNKSKSAIFYEEAVSYFLKNVADESEIEQHFQKATEEIGLFLQKLSKIKMAEPMTISSMYLGFLSRIILSAVIYGDRKDTRQFMTQRNDPVLDIDWDFEKTELEQKLTSFSKDTYLNQVRADISEQCAIRSAEHEDIYQLNVPTGGGKTLSSLRYAYSHSAYNNKKRVFFVIPLLSILDQNAEVIKANISNPEMVLEHHSNVIREKPNDKDSLDVYELLTDTWNNPIVITTLVQLLNTLFSGKTTEVGRLQALVNSTIIIDEVQTMPTKTILMCNCMMNFLRDFCKTTIVLSSATQPALGDVKWPIEYSNNVELVRLTLEEMQAFKRAKIQDATSKYGMTDEEMTSFCTQIIEKRDSLLVICNTKKEARNLFQILNALGSDEELKVFHLSTCMCKAHRMEVLDEIRERLEMIQRMKKVSQDHCSKIICVSTQLVEAGIDFSFEVVVRIMAGIDNLAQAAGRCNRSNDYPQLGEVYLVNLKNEGKSLVGLPDIVASQNATRDVLNSSHRENIIGPDATRLFYRRKFNELSKEMCYPLHEKGNTYELAKMLGINPVSQRAQYLLQQPFQYIGSHFSVFDNNTTDIIVPYRDGFAVIQKLREMDTYHLPLAAAIETIRKSKPYVISVYEGEKKRLLKENWIEALFDGRVMVLSESIYDSEIGLYVEAINNNNTYMY